MSFDSTTPNWKLTIDALAALGGVASIPELERYFKEHYPPEKRATNVKYEVVALSVNANSRIHYGAGKQPRKTDTGNQYDRLFRRQDKRYELYSPEKHGIWEIVKDSQGNLFVQQESEPTNEDFPDMNPTSIAIHNLETELDVAENSIASRFAMESHLRDYLAQNLKNINGMPTQLYLFSDESGAIGVEYRTPIGIIDILAKGADGAFYILELKVARGSDAVIGQVLRYMGWVRENLANGAPVYGVVVASSTSDKIKYAASEVPNILLMEYELSFALKISTKL